MGRVDRGSGAFVERVTDSGNDKILDSTRPGNQSMRTAFVRSQAFFFPGIPPHGEKDKSIKRLAFSDGCCFMTRLAWKGPLPALGLLFSGALPTAGHIIMAIAQSA
ncbi:MAG: hypothetical protein FD149_1188 [Rhodospirillaceae bacterium]|nr:MAG: hypothetical protein FD149_1188 [Rhodospirillaceae bacterium]